MKKLYFILPLVGLAAFIFVYLNFKETLDQKERDKQVAAAAAKKAKLDKEVEARKKAQEDAIALQAQRKQEKAEREAQKAKNDQQLADLKQEAEKLRRERDRIEGNVKRTQKDIDEQKSLLVKVEERREMLSKEQEHLRALVKAAEGNVRSLEAVLLKIEAAEKAAQEAARAVAKKANS